MVDLQDILAAHGADFRNSHKLSPDQAKAFSAILNCRTSVMGAHMDECEECGYQRISYNSCRNRHCPKCQTVTKEQWLDRQRQYLMNIGYFHVVFTLPDTLNPIVYQNQETVYNLFYRAVSETLLELCADPKYLDAKPGVTAILHTWGQNLQYHPHIHCVVTGGGLTSAGDWRPSRKKFFLPVKVLSRKFKGKFMAFLRQTKLQFYSSEDRLKDPETWAAFISGLYNKDWVVYCKPPFKNASKVLDYLGRYTHRVAISNHRIVSLTDGKVTFKWRDYSDSNKQKLMTVMAEEFIRRFLLHILPSGFRKIRHFGLLAPRGKTERIANCRRLTGSSPPAPLMSAYELLGKIFGPCFDICPCCGLGHLSRASPATETA